MREKILQNKICLFLQDPYLCTPKVLKMYAEVAQLVEHDLAKVGVASSNLVFRSNPFHKKGFVFKRIIIRSGGGTGRHAGLKILFAATRVRVQVPPGALEKSHLN